MFWIGGYLEKIRKIYGTVHSPILQDPLFQIIIVKWLDEIDLSTVEILEHGDLHLIVQLVVLLIERVVELDILMLSSDRNEGLIVLIIITEISNGQFFVFQVIELLVGGDLGGNRTSLLLDELLNLLWGRVSVVLVDISIREQFQGRVSLDLDSG